MDRIFIFLLCFYFCSGRIKINKLDVPSEILYGSQNDVILDCDFDAGGDTVTEIKWFLNGNSQIYQWLPNTNRTAQAIGKLKNHIDVKYKATDDESTMYRALHITDLSPEFSGNYTCKVSGPMSEDVETKRMIIYVSPENDDLDIDGSDDESDDDEDGNIDDGTLNLSLSEETSEISCSSGGFYPQPNMTIYIVNDNETDILLRQDDETVSLNEDEYSYNVSSILKFDILNSTQSFYYTCEVNIPGTSYSINKTLFFIQEDVSEIQLDEGFFNSTNCTESSFDEAQESASARHLSTLSLTFFVTTILGLLYL